MKLVCAAALAACAVSGWGTEDWSRIYLGGDPVLAADGSTFAFDWNGRLWQAPATGGTAQPISSTACGETAYCLSPDGTRLAYAADRGTGVRVFERNLKDGSDRQVTFHSETARPWCYTTDGSNLVCTLSRDAAGPKDCLRIATIPVFARGPEQVVIDCEGTCPALSPDGKILLFARLTSGKATFRKRRHSTTSQKGEIWAYEFATKKFTLLVRKEVEARDPVWAPDGQSFYYLQNVKGIRNLVRRVYKTGAEVMLTAFTDEHMNRPSLTRDGRLALFRQGFDYWRLDLTIAGAKPQKICVKPAPGCAPAPVPQQRVYTGVTNLDDAGDVTFCSEGMQCAFTACGVLFVMDTEIRQPVRVAGGGLDFVRACRFTPDGQRLFYVVDRGDGSDVRVAERADKSRGWWENTAFQSKTILSDDVTRSAFSLSPDGTRMAWQNPRGRFTFATTDGKKTWQGPANAGAGTYAWSPDGQWVATGEADANGNREVWIVSVEGKQAPYNVSRNFKWDGSPAWSPDGKILAFCSEIPEEGGERLCYVYLDPADEERETQDQRLENARKKVPGTSTTNTVAKAESKDAKAEPKSGLKKAFTKKAKPEPAKKPEAKKAKPETKIVFEGLCDRVRVIRGASAGYPFFSHDSRTLAFRSNNRTMKVHLPDKLAPQQLFAKGGAFRGWLAKGDRVLRVVNNHPAHGDTEFNFSAHVAFSPFDHQELGFKMAWAHMRDCFYDPQYHGADWASMKARYLPAARNATSALVFRQVVEMMLGELDASHLGLRTSNDRLWKTGPSAQGWSEQTAHLGLRFDPTWTGAGWKIRDVVKGGPAERASFDFRAGDRILAINGVAVKGGEDPTRVLNGPANREVEVTVAARGGADKADHRVRIGTQSFAAARDQVGAAVLKARREYVHQKSKGRFGYLNIDAMDMKSFWLFQKEVFSEGWGREGLLIDVRDNGGGSTTDKILMILLGGDHARVFHRDFTEGYPLSRWERPLWTKPVTILCNEYSASNAEILTHAIKTLKRGRVVGLATAGAVISTSSRDVLDLGSLRDPHAGWFRKDGQDMEFHGAEPDVKVYNDPPELVRGVDAQLEAALMVLDEDVKAAQKANTLAPLKWAR